MWFQEGPARADENNHNEQQSTPKEIENVVRNIPAMRRTHSLHIPLVFRLANQVQGFQHDQNGHENVDAMHWQLLLPTNIAPDSQQNKVRKKEGKEKRRQLRLSNRQVILDAFL